LKKEKKKFENLIETGITRKIARLLPVGGANCNNKRRKKALSNCKVDL